jgi:hypothetical protein
MVPHFLWPWKSLLLTDKVWVVPVNALIHVNFTNRHLKTMLLPGGCSVPVTRMADKGQMTWTDNVKFYILPKQNRLWQCGYLRSHFRMWLVPSLKTVHKLSWYFNMIVQLWSEKIPMLQACREHAVRGALEWRPRKSTGKAAEELSISRFSSNKNCD